TPPPRGPRTARPRRSRCRRGWWVLRPLLQRLRLLERLIDRADHVEGLLGQRIVLPADDALEAADGVLERHDLAVLAGEHLGHVEGLRQEALHLAGTVHGELVLLGQL